MADVHDKFAAALQRRLDGNAVNLTTLPEILSPDVARQAKVAEDVIAAAVAETLELPLLPSLDKRPISHDFVTAIPIAFARRHVLVGLACEDGPMQLVVSDLNQWPQVQTVSKLLGKKVQPVVAPRGEIIKAINAAYQQQPGQAQKLIDQLDTGEVMRELEQASQSTNEDLLDVASRAPVIKLVNLILLEAVKKRASDVHIQPYEDRLVVRLRVDGVLRDVFEPPQGLQQEVISRIKIMGGMNIAEHRLAQDGRATVEVGDRLIDLRISTLPTSFGERAVIRLLDKSIRLFELERLGMPPGVLQTYRKLIHQDHGIILVTGPTGSGKSTTLYAALQELNSQELNILTLEDPIEYRLEGISQTQVSDKKGMTFASGLRHVLRQDPDIIMVGEIRDAETAHMAIQSALTGHLVFSTLHTNDAAGAVARMLDLGVEPYLLASSLLGVLAQRLVRRTCPNCRTEYQPTALDFARWGLSPETLASHGGMKFYRGAGCEECMHTGYSQRVGIFEMLVMTEPIREQILLRAKASTLKELAQRDGMTSLNADGVQKVLAGETTMDEVTKATGREEF